MQPDFSLIKAVVLLLVLMAFGIGYNAMIARAERRHYLEGFTSLAVAAGVGFTLIIVAIYDWRAAVTVLIGFAASGVPMIVGSIMRYIKLRNEEQEHERQTARMAQPGPLGKRSGR
jgi:hypothetical protein